MSEKYFLEIKKEQYNKKLNEFLRNVTLERGDLDENGLLSSQFFLREDIGVSKKIALSALTKELKKYFS